MSEVKFDAELAERLEREAREDRMLVVGSSHKMVEQYSDERALVTALADQLAAARKEIERLSGLSELRGQTVADLAHELGTVKGKRDIERPVVESAEQWRESMGCRGNHTTDDALIAAVDAYRAARGKEGR